MKYEALDKLKLKERRIRIQIEELKSEIQSMDPGQVRLRYARKQLARVKTACTLGLVQLEKAWNPYGENDSHKYEEILSEVIKSRHHRISKAKSTLTFATISFVQAQRDLHVHADIDNQSIKMTYWAYGLGAKGWRLLKSGPFETASGFRVRVRQTRKWRHYKTWSDSVLAIVDCRTRLADCWRTLEKVYEEEECSPGHEVQFYGLSHERMLHFLNLRKTREEDTLAWDEPIDIIYDREAQTVKFSSSTFEFY